MLKIAFCDDSKLDRQSLTEILGSIEEKWNEEFDIYAFESGEELCESLAFNTYHVILLDILMNGMDGIETAARIRSMGNDCLIIFISSYDDRVKELFDFRTIAFIDKPIVAQKLELGLERAYEIIKKDQENFFAYTKKGSMHYLAIKNIRYFESRRNEIIAYTEQGDVSFYDTLSSIWSKVCGMEQFIMPHRSYIFNLSHVTLKSDQVIVRKTGECISIGQKYKEDTTLRYVRFIEKRCI